MIENIINSRGNRVANQFRVSTAKGIYFQSYSSVVAFVDNNRKITLGRNWDYSNTTTKHLYNFFRSCGISFLNSKKEVLQAIKSGQIKENRTNNLIIK